MSHHVATYPTEEQYEYWKRDADEMDIPMSEYVEIMVQAGRSKIQIRTETDSNRRSIREQRDDLKEELDHARRRIEQLENRLIEEE